MTFSHFVLTNIFSLDYENKHITFYGKDQNTINPIEISPRDLFES